MPNFTTRNIDLIKAKMPVEQLVVNGVGQLDDLEARLKGTMFLPEFKKLILQIQHVADGGKFGKFCKILKGGASGTEYEFSSDHLRIFVIPIPGKKLLVYGGKKHAADTSDLIAIFRRLKQQYLESLTL